MKRGNSFEQRSRLNSAAQNMLVTTKENPMKRDISTRDTALAEKEIVVLLKQENLQLVAKIQTFENQKQAISLELERAQRDLILLSKGYEELRSAQQDHEQLQSEINQKHKETCLLNLKVQALDKENQSLTQQIKTSNDKFLILENEKNDLDAARKQLHIDLDTLKNGILERDNLVDQFRNNEQVNHKMLQDTNKELNNSKRIIQKMTKEYEDCLAEFENKENALKDKFETDLKQKTKEFNAKIDRLNEYIEEVNNENHNLKQELANANSEIKRRDKYSKEQRSELEVQLKNMNIIPKSIETKDIAQEISKKIQGMNKKDEEISKLIEIRDTFKDECSALQSKFDSLIQERNELEQLTGCLKEEKAGIAGELERQKKECQMKSEIYDDISEELTQAKTDLRKKTSSTNTKNNKTTQKLKILNLN